MPTGRCQRSLTGCAWFRSIDRHATTGKNQPIGIPDIESRRTADYTRIKKATRFSRASTEDQDDSLEGYDLFGPLIPMTIGLRKPIAPQLNCRDSGLRGPISRASQKRKSNSRRLMGPH